MSKILGIVCEYNPFHNGHLYHLNESKKETNPDYTVCIMSGNFVERGNTAIIDKWERTKMALSNGADMVIELPTIYSISSAENFAYGAIKLLNSLNTDTTISFGSESGNLEILNQIADILIEEPQEYLSILNHELSRGLSYPKARENAILMYLNDIRKYANVLSSPNNILAIEYLKSLKKLKSKITPLIIKRAGPDYNSTETMNNFASATAIREKIKNNENTQDLMPTSSYEIFENCIKRGKFIPDISNFEKEIMYVFRTMTIEQISNLPDVSEGLENKIKNAANCCNNLSDFISMVKSKRYTYSRISRICLYALIGITKQDMINSLKTVPYLRVLGVNNKGKKLLSELKRNNKKLQIITSVKDFMDNSNNKILKNMLQLDIKASNIYTLGFEYGSEANLDYTNKLITL